MNAIDRLLKKIEETLQAQFPTFKTLPAKYQNSLTRAFLGDLILEQKISVTTSFHALERHPEKDIETLIELLDFSSIPPKMLQFYKNKTQNPPSPEIS